MLSNDRSIWGRKDVSGAGEVSLSKRFLLRSEGREEVKWVKKGEESLASRGNSIYQGPV